MKTLICLLSLLFTIGINNSVLSQTTVNKGKEGNIEIIQAPQIKDLLDKYTDLNSKSTVKGYRVKIHFGNDKAQAYEIKDKFTGKFIDIPAYVRYDQPYFSVRVGNYRTKLEAYKFLKQVQSEYPTAFFGSGSNRINPLAVFFSVLKKH